MSGLKKSHLLASLCAVAALSACESVSEEVNEAVGFEYTAILAPMAGAVGSGKAEVSLNDATNTICTDLELAGVGTVSAAYITGPGGDRVASIDTPDDNDSDDCDDTSDLLIDGIKANPTGYSVHVETSTGNLHGTLRKER